MATRAALLSLETKLSVIEEPFTLTLRGGFANAAQGKALGFGVCLREIDPGEIVREVIRRIKLRTRHHQCARSVARRLYPFAQSHRALLRHRRRPKLSGRIITNARAAEARSVRDQRCVNETYRVRAGMS